MNGGMLNLQIDWGIMPSPIPGKMDLMNKHQKFCPLSINLLYLNIQSATWNLFVNLPPKAINMKLLPRISIHYSTNRY